jgi:hypothetical protein
LVAATSKAADDAASEIAQKSPMSEDELTRLSKILKGVGYPKGNREEMLRLKLFGVRDALYGHESPALANPQQLRT